MARLPNPGSDNDEWGTILNNFLSIEHNSDGTLKKSANITGSEQSSAKGQPDGYAPLDSSAHVPLSNLPLPLSQANSHATPDTDTSTTALHHTLGIGANQASAGNHGHTLTSLTDYDNTSPPATNKVIAWNGTKYAPASLPSLTTNAAYPLSAYGFFSASAPLESFYGQSTLGSMFFARVLVPAGHPISVVATVLAGAGTVGAGGNNCFAIYDDAGNQVATTPANNAQWASVGWSIGTLATPIPAQQTDRFVYVSGFVIGYSSIPSIVYNVLGHEALTYMGNGVPTHRRAFYANGVSSLPPSINPASYGSNSNYLPLYALG
jgi:hypothetical protein